MKVFIITEGGKNIGFGHITRCIALYQALTKKGISAEFIINGDRDTKSLLKDKKFKIFNWLEKWRELFNIVKNAEMVIIDSYLADIDLYRKISKVIKLPVYIDDSKRLDYPAGFVVNGMIYAEDLDYQRRDGITYLLGSHYIPLREEFWDVPKKTIRDEVESVMITFGGVDRRNMTPIILKSLNENYPKLTKTVIIGGGFQNVKQIETLKNKKTNLIYNPDAKKMEKIMEKSDIAISASGQTLYELARMGIPTIAICMAENQLKNITGWKQNGFLNCIGWYNDDALIEKLKYSMKRLKDRGIREARSEIGRKSIDGKGSLRMVNSLLSSYFKDKLLLRNASFNDALDIFNLSNDDAVRRVSLVNPEKIRWDHHVKWFKERLSDRNCVFFVYEILDKFCGQARYDIDPRKKEAVASISLTENIRGFGLSSFALKEAINKFLKIRKNIKTIKAYIKNENVASIKCFEKANFKFSKDAIIKGSKVKIYIRGTDI